MGLPPSGCALAIVNASIKKQDNNSFFIVVTI
jgi:hypothetical protein